MPSKVLKEIFGFDSFRPGQEEAIRAVLEGRDTLAVMPTGGGKSLCYQIPALMQESLTVIVSPLISLMKDQVNSLIQSSVTGAATLHSGLSPEERWEVERRVRTGETKMLYVAPERLRSLEFVLSLRRAGVGLFVVDEAHCISEWGHNFRPDYLFLPRVVRDLGNPPVLALTATATPRVRQDILLSLKLRSPEVVVTSFNRPNLIYRVIPAKEKKHKLPRILDVIRASRPPGMGSADRVDIQERFMTDELAVVVATIAFGMGVDKPNVRFVIHSSVPGSLPAYIQESGRAGRDGEGSECVVLYRGADLGRRKRLVTLGTAGERGGSSFFRAPSGGESDGRGNALPGSGSVGLPELARKVGLRPAVVQGAIYRMMVDGVVEVIPRGSLVDVRLKTFSLDNDSRRNIAGRLKNRANTAYAQIRDVESYANLRTCRREHLLRHFGDMEEVAPCAGCDVCLGETQEHVRTLGPGTSVPEGKPLVPAFAGSSRADEDLPGVDAALFERLRSWRSEQAKKQRVPAYVVLHNSHLEEISARKPGTIHELGTIKGVGLRRAARYGDEILALIRGEAPDTASPAENGFREHLEIADKLLRTGRGADAVPALARALELGGEEARREVDELLGSMTRQ